jgi:hypothetical protein
VLYGYKNPVVEDNEDSRLILMWMLKHFGYEAIGAATGPVAGFLVFAHLR